jgi:hypothetical protein
MSERLRVEVTLTFEVDTAKWQDAYGETITATDAGDLRTYFEGVKVTDLIPAADEWVPDTDHETDVTVRVNGMSF